LQGINFTVLDNLGAVAPVTVIMRTSETVSIAVEKAQGRPCHRYLGPRTLAFYSHP
jgi:hypothetical protein